MRDDVNERPAEPAYTPPAQPERKRPERDEREGSAAVLRTLAQVFNRR